MSTIEKNINQIVCADSLLFLKKIEDEKVDLIITSPPYWNAVTYDSSKNEDYNTYLDNLEKIFIECARVLKPNGKLAINLPILPIPKNIIEQDIRHLKDISLDVNNKILSTTNLNLFSLYIWQKQTSKLMFGSYPYPSNLLENNTIEFIRIYVKPGKNKKYPQYIKDSNKIKKHEWIDLIQQVWFMIPEDISRKKNHPAPFPQKLPARLMRMFTYGATKNFEGDIVLDPFVGTGTTCVVAKKMNRRFIGIDISENYVEYAKGRLFKAKQGEGVNYLIGKTKHDNKEELEKEWNEIKKSRNIKLKDENLIRAVKKHRTEKFGRDVKKVNVQKTLFDEI